MDDRDYEAMQDYLYEEHLAELYAEYKEEAIGEFQAERLKSYYLANPTDIAPAMGLLAEARMVVDAGSPRAALALAVAASEVGIKLALLKPIVFGLVHSDAAAGLVTDLVLKHRGISSFQKLLFQIVGMYAEADLNTFKRPGASMKLWSEIVEVQDLRNGALHRGDVVIAANAQRAIDIASTVVEIIFPDLVRGIGLHLHDHTRVCGDSHESERMEALFRQFRLPRTSNVGELPPAGTNPQ